MLWRNPDAGEDFWEEPDSWLRDPSEPEASLAESGSGGSKSPSWPRSPVAASLKGQLALAEWYIERQLYGFATLNQMIEIDSDRRGGVPVLRGTGFTVAQIFAELADTNAVDEIADDLDLDANDIRELINGFSLVMQRPYGK